jgi:hypothetical protein
MLALIKAILSYLRSNERAIRRSSATARWILLYLRLARGRIRRWIFRHIVVVTSAIALMIGAYGFFTPEWLPKWCYKVSAREGSISLREERKCEPGEIYAVRWLAESKEGKITGSVLYDTFVEKPSVWIEKYIDDRGTHGWIRVSSVHNENLPLRGCRESSAHPVKTRTGSLFITKEPRPLNRKVFAALKDPARKAEAAACFVEANVGNPKFAYCQWGRFQMFVEDGTSGWCRKRHVIDYYRSKRTFAADEFSLCVRGVELDGKTVREGYTWESYGERSWVDAVWCD